MKDFEMTAPFLFIQQTSAELMSISSGPPDPKTIKRKALLLIKARVEPEDFEGGEMFPTGIEKEVVFMEITGKILTNLYASCHVSAILIPIFQKFL